MTDMSVVTARLAAGSYNEAEVVMSRNRECDLPPARYWPPDRTVAVTGTPPIHGPHE
jgi:hypothetical protein